MNDAVRICQKCGASFTKAGGSWPMFARRKFCGPLCRSAAHKVDMSEAQRQREEWRADDPGESKVCDQCGQVFRRNKTTARTAFRMRRFCNKACLDAGRKSGKVKNAVRWADK